MKKGWIVLVALVLGASAAYAADLYKEFQRREATVLSREVRNALNYLRQIEYDVNNIQEIESLPDGRFVFKDANGNVCLGDQAAKMLRCKNVIGLSTVNYEGDGD